MDEINNLFQGFAVALTLPNIGFMFIGIFLGVLIGVLPGLGGANKRAIDAGRRTEWRPSGQ
jgi:putative tricarboxylic transport membrane protein